MRHPPYPGGPGGDQALDMPRVFTFLFSGTASQSILDEYDLIGFDPRGNNHSSPVSCGLTEQQTDQLVPTIEQDDSFDATRAFVKSVAAGCAKSSGPLLPFMTTVNTVRDMEAIRRGLGEARINYFAGSYGSYLGAAYASLYPNNTDRIVIDSSVDPNWVWRTQFLKWGLGGQDRWPDFANFAAANDATYHLGNTPDQVTALFFKLMAQADEHPFQDSSFFDDGTLINGAMFQAVAFSLLENDAFFVDMVQLFQDTEAATSGTSAASRSKVLPRDIQVPADNPTSSGLTVLGQRSRLVSIDGGGHAVFGLEPDSVCAANFVTDYLTNGTFSDQDEFCPASPAADLRPNTAVNPRAGSQGAPGTATAVTDTRAAGKDWVRRRLLHQMGLLHLK